MNPHSYRAGDFLEHMLERVDRIEEYARGMSYEDFFADVLIQDAVLRNLEVLGEAAKNLTIVLPDAPLRFPRIPFQDIYRTRNRLSHGYVDIDLELVWRIITKELPPLRGEIEAAIRSWNETSAMS